VFKRTLGGKRSLFVFSPEGIGLVWPDGPPAEPWGEELLKQIRTFVNIGVSVWAGREGHDCAAILEMQESRPDLVRVIYHGKGMPGLQVYSSLDDAVTAVLGGEELTADSRPVSVGDAVRQSLH
jgi:hypothetical protein